MALNRRDALKLALVGVALATPVVRIFVRRAEERVFEAVRSARGLPPARPLDLSSVGPAPSLAG
jgi:hypothetical protein